MRLIAAVVIAALMCAAVPSADEMNKNDRQRLLAHFEMTESWLAGEIAGLSPAQLRFRMTPDSWSVMDVVEHLAVAEPQYWKTLQDSMKEPATAGKTEASDAAILWYGIDRTDRQRTGEARVPKGRYDDVKRSFAEFTALRKTMREYAAKTSDDLRSRRLLQGNMDVYQWFLMISSHSQRHILQIREIKSHANYPSK
jgi:DinB superfamily